MKTLILVFHPDITTSRINRRLAKEMEKQADVTVHHFYEAAEQRLLKQHDRVVLQFPFYWYSTPSLLKKWEDEVLTYGWAYGSNGDKLHGKELLIAVSTAGTEKYDTISGRHKYTVPELLRPL